MAKDHDNQPEPTQPVVPVLWSVSMVVGPHPGVHIVAGSKEEAETEYRKRYHLADNVELWVGKVPG